MRITDIETFAVPPRWLFCRIGTDAGISGWGEPVVEGRAATVAAAVDELADYLRGKDPLRIEDHWQVMTRGTFYRGGPVLSSAVAGLDIALWDIAGRASGLPIHRLLGGPARDRMRVYAHVGGDSAEAAASEAAGRVAAGYTAVKTSPAARVGFLDTPAALAAMVERVAAIRAAVGPAVDVALDLHGRFSAPMARRLLPALEPLQPLFVEEPVRPEHSAALPGLVAATSIPIATGERLYHRTQFRPVLDAGVAVVQPDVCHAGGISETVRIAALAGAYDAQLAPHCPLGPIALAASLQVCFACSDVLIQEQVLGVHQIDGNPALALLRDPAPLAARDGWVDRPTGAGLGVEVDEDAVRRAAAHGHRWRTPLQRHDDGSFAEW